MIFKKVDKVTKYNLDIDPITVKGRKNSVIQIDTDSTYCCFEEFKNEVFPDMEAFTWFYAMEEMMQDMWNKVLQIRADKKRVPQLIKFLRENMFYGFFSFAKKLYIGSIIDSEGIKYSIEKYSPKIKGVVLQKQEFPDFCKETATPLVFDILHGLSREETMKRILQIYEQFKQQPVDKICSHRQVSAYGKYVHHTIDWYVEHGLQYDTGMPAQVKMALAYNYICAKHKLVLEPIDRGTKYCYIFLNQNKYNIDCIGFVGNWPKEFNEIFTIDYETCFRKFFLSIFENMFKILNWLGPKEQIELKQVVSINKFLRG